MGETGNGFWDLDEGKYLKRKDQNQGRIKATLRSSNVFQPIVRIFCLRMHAKLMRLKVQVIIFKYVLIDKSHYHSKSTFTLLESKQTGMTSTL